MPNAPELAHLIRLNKFLSECGAASRRGADELIKQGRVRVNGALVEEPGVRIDPRTDQVQVDDKPVARPVVPTGDLGVTVLLHKPVQVVTTAKDPQGRQTVFELLPEELRAQRLLHVGRLDYFSEGLLLLTSDGSLCNRLIHPRWHLPKTYHVQVRGQVTEKKLDIMRKGQVLAEGERLAPIDARMLQRQDDHVWLEMVLLQGLNRQIRRMCRDLDLTVLRLIRVKQGPIALGTLNPGQSRLLTDEELRALRASVGLQEGGLKEKAPPDKTVGAPKKPMQKGRAR